MDYEDSRLAAYDTVWYERNVPNSAGTSYFHLLCRRVRERERAHFSDTENMYHTGSAKFQKAVSLM